MDNKIKIRTCRICLNANSVDIVLLEENNGWLRLFEFCFGFTLTTEDKPRLLCKACAEKVQNYVEFKEICQKSHRLWKSVISDVKCYIVKHQNLESTNQYVNDPIAIKDESIDGSTDNDSHFSNEDETLHLSPADIKTEIDEEDMKLKYEESLQKPNEKDYLVRKQVNSKQKRCKKVNGDDSVKCKEKKVYTCENCKMKMQATKSFYLKHLKRCQAEAYDCGLCNDNFTNIKDMCLHLNNHWSNNDLACKLCDFVGVDVAAIAVHRYSHLVRIGPLRFRCHICGKKTQTLLGLHFHYRKEHLNKAGGYCSKCNKECTTLRYWKRHEATHRTPRHICDVCGKGFYFKYAIREHMISHMQLNNCICDICGNIYRRQRYLKLHKNTVHTNLGPFKCTHCNRFFKTEFYLKKHKKIVAREKTLKCEVCQKFFATRNVLKLHMVMHSDERPHRCEICDCSYKHKSHLKAHMLMHTDFSPHKCLICSKTFTTATSLKRHSSVHTRVRRYSCSVSSCTRTFQSKKLMLAHLQVSHKDENLDEK